MIKRIESGLAAMLVAIVMSGVTAAQPVRLTDAQVVAIYVQVNSFDIETALLGQRVGSTDSVRALAAHVAADHLGVRKSILELARSEGISIELPAFRAEAQLEHDAVMARLAALKGREFDRAFLAHDIAFHKAAIEAVRTLLIPNTTNARLKQHFETVLPAFEGHLASTEAVAGGRPFKHGK